MEDSKKRDSEHLIAVFPVKTLFAVAVFFATIAGFVGYTLGRDKNAAGYEWKSWAAGGMAMQAQIALRFPEVREELLGSQTGVDGFLAHQKKTLCGGGP